MADRIHTVNVVLTCWGIKDISNIHMDSPSHAHFTLMASQYYLLDAHFVSKEEEESLIVRVKSIHQLLKVILLTIAAFSMHFLMWFITSLPGSPSPTNYTCTCKKKERESLGTRLEVNHQLLTYMYVHTIHLSITTTSTRMNAKSWHF